MKWTLLFALALVGVGGCGMDRAPLLASKAELKPNVGQTVRLVGTVHRYRTGPIMLEAEEFQIALFPREMLSAAGDGKKIHAIGVLEDTSHATAPDPSIAPGQYWLNVSNWSPADREGQ